MKPRTLHEPTRALVGKGARVWPSRNKSQELPEPTRTIRGPPPRALSPGPARSKPIASQSRFSEGTFCSCVVKDSTDVQMYRTVDVCIWRQRRKASQCALAMRKPHHTTPHTNPHHTLHHTPHPKEKEIPFFLSFFSPWSEPMRVRLLRGEAQAVPAASRMMRMFPMGQTILEDGNKRAEPMAGAPGATSGTKQKLRLGNAGRTLAMKRGLFHPPLSQAGPSLGC